MLAVVISLVTMRRMTVSPLGVARRVRRSTAGWRWAPVLGVGLAFLAWTATRDVNQQGGGQTTLAVAVGLGLGLTAFGLLGTATWSAWVLAR